MSNCQKSESVVFKQYDRTIIDFIEENRKMIKKKLELITYQLRNLEEENEKMILKFTQYFITPNYIKEQTNKSSTSTSNINSNSNINNNNNNTNSNNINGNLILFPVSSTSRISKVKSPKAQKHSSHSNKRKRKDGSSNISQYGVLSGNNSHYAKRCYDKYCYVKDKLRMELNKKNKKCISLYDKTTNGNSNINKPLSQNYTNANNSLSYANFDNKSGNKTIKTQQHVSIDNNDYENMIFSNRNRNSSNVFNVNVNANANASENGNANSKDKAIECIIKSNVFTLKEKMLFWFTNAHIQSIIRKSKVIDDYRNFIQSKERHYENMILFKPSSTALNCLTFIRSSDEDELKLLANKGDDKELNQLTGVLTLLYALLGIDSSKMTNSKMILHLYANVFKAHNVLSIKQLITDVICSNLMSGINNKKSIILPILLNYSNVFDAARYLQLNRAISFISFILKDIVTHIMGYDENKNKLLVYQGIVSKCNFLLSID